MDKLAPEISNLIYHLVAQDKLSLIQLSSISKFFRGRLAPRLFGSLDIKIILEGGHPNAVEGRSLKLLEFARTSKWNVCVESIKLGVELPFPLPLQISNYQNLNHEGDVLGNASSSPPWFPQSLTYVLSNLSSLFPSLHTLEICFPSTLFPCTDTPDLTSESMLGMNEISYHHTTQKLLNLTFGAVAQNQCEEVSELVKIESRGSSNRKKSEDQRIKHFVISELPPFGCDALLSPRFQTFIRNLVSFTLETSEEYNLEKLGYYNVPLRGFLIVIIPGSFLSHLYSGTSLEYLRLMSLTSCSIGVTESMCFKPQPLGSLKTLVLENILLSYQNTITDAAGLGEFIKANSSTLEVIELTGAAWIAEDLPLDSIDHWGSFWEFLREHRPRSLRRLQINVHIVDRRSLQESTDDFLKDVGFRYTKLEEGYGYFPWDISDDPISEFRRMEDFKQWVLLRNSILGSKA